MGIHGRPRKLLSKDTQEREQSRNSPESCQGLGPVHPRVLPIATGSADGQFNGEMRPLQRLFNALVCLIGVPILTFTGWGWTHLPAYFDRPALVAYVVLLSVMKAAHQLLTDSDVLGGGLPDKEVRAQILFLPIGLLLPVVLAVFLPWADRHGVGTLESHPAPAIFGLISLAAGQVAIGLGTWNLGRLYSTRITIQPDHRLVTRGIYGIIRHPIYLGLILSLAGMSLVFRSWWGLAVTGAVIGTVLWRIRDEERMMIREFGDAYERYRRDTWGMVPGVY